MALYGRCFNKVAWSEFFKVTGNQHDHWAATALENFEAVVSQDAFPCLFGKKAVGAGQAQLLFVSAAAEQADLFCGLTDYVRQVEAWPMKARLGKPLIVFFERNDLESLEQQQRYAWQRLQHLHDHDPHPWPTTVAADLHSEHWSFSFMGMPLFINMSFPKHQLIKSRNLGAHIVFVINPRENFDHVAAGHTLSGQRIRERIRSRSEAYNQGVLPSTLGVYGEPGSLEFKQYQLEEPGALSHRQCPFRMNGVERPVLVEAAKPGVGPR